MLAVVPMREATTYSPVSGPLRLEIDVARYNAVQVTPANAAYNVSAYLLE